MGRLYSKSNEKKTAYNRLDSDWLSSYSSSYDRRLAEEEERKRQAELNKPKPSLLSRVKSVAKTTGQAVAEGLKTTGRSLVGMRERGNLESLPPEQRKTAVFTPEQEKQYKQAEKKIIRKQLAASFEVAPMGTVFKGAGIGKSVASGAIIGAAGGAAAGFEEERPTLKSVATSAAIGAGFGGTLGAGGSIARKAFQKTPVKFGTAAEAGFTTRPLKTEPPVINVEWKTGKKAYQQYDAENNKSIITVPSNVSENTIWHEIAHAVDRQKPGLREQLAPEIKSITGKNYVDNEIFAAAFKQVSTKPEIRNQAPQISSIMDSIQLPQTIKVKQNRIVKTATPTKPTETMPTGIQTPLENKNVSSAISQPRITEQTGNVTPTEGFTVSKFYKGTDESRYGRKINSAKINTQEDIQQLNQELNDKYTKLFQNIKGGRKLNEVTVKEAEALGWDLNKIKSLPDGAMLNDAQVVAVAQIKADLTLELAETAKAYKQVPSDELKGKMNDLVSKILYTDAVTKRSETYLGRAIQAKQVTPIPREFDDSIMDIIEKAGISNVTDLKSAVAAAEKLKEPTNITNLTALYKAGLIGNPISVLKQLPQNLAMGTGEIASRQIASGIDFLIGLKTKQRGIVSPSYAQIAKGFATGLKEIPDALAGNAQSKRVEQFMPIKYKSKIADKTLGSVTRGIFNLFGAFDKPAYSAAYKESLENSARVIAMNEKLTGKLFDARVKDLVLDPTDEIVKIATNDAEYATLQMANTMSTVANKVKSTLRDKNPVYGVAADIVAPLTRTPGGAVKAIKDYSIFGLLNVLSKDVKSNQKELALALSRPIVGTSLLLVGAILAKNGLVTGNLPKDKSTRTLWDLQGKKARAIKIGGKWRSLDSLSTIGSILSVGAQFNENGILNPSNIFEMSKVITDQPFLVGPSAALKASQDPREAEYFAESTLSGMVPFTSLMGRISKAVDSTQRQPDGIRERVLSKIPGQSFEMKAKLNAFGEEMPQDQQGLAQFYDIFNSREPKETGLNSLLEKIYENDLSINIPDKKTKIPVKGQRVGRIMNDDELYEYRKIFGQNVKKELSKNNEILMRITGEKFEKKYNTIIEAAREQSKKRND